MFGGICSGESRHQRIGEDEHRVAAAQVAAPEMDAQEERIGV